MTEEQKKKNQNRIVTPTFRVSFPNVFKARLNTLSNKEEFSIVMIFDKETDLTALKRFAQEAVIAKWGDKKPANLRSPFRNGDTDRADREEFINKIFITAKSNYQPAVVDENVQPILDQSQFYAGCYAKASVNCYTYSQMGNNGVSFGLLNVQKVNDGEPFSSRRRAEDDFAPVDPENQASDNNEEELFDL